MSAEGAAVTNSRAPGVPAAPATSRGRRTRDRLLVAARQVFEEKGFLDTRVEQIVQAAGVAYGSFYRYFQSKEDVFAELTTMLFEDMTNRQHAAIMGTTPRDRISRANRSYCEAYLHNAAMMAIVEQVATINPEFRVLRREHRMRETERSAQAIRHWQEQGMVSADLNPELTAMSLGAMVDHTLYLYLIHEELSDTDDLLRTLDQLCLRALGLEPPPTR